MYKGGFGSPPAPVGWQPTNLFTAGEKGIWYDFSDTSTLFQDTSRTVAVTTAGDPIAAVNDKSGNGLFGLASNDNTRPTYQSDGSMRMETTNSKLDTIQTDYWSFLHNSPATVAIAFVPSLVADPDSIGVVVGTTDIVGSAETGYITGYDDRWSSGRNNGLLTLISGGVFGAYVVNSFVDNVLTLQTGQRYINQSKPNAVAADRLDITLNGAGIDDKNTSLEAPNTSSEQGVLTLGSLTRGDFPFQGFIKQLVIVDRVLTAQELNELDNYLANKL